MTPAALAAAVAEALDAKKARDLVVLDLEGLTGVADRFVLATAEADRHLDALADAAVEAAGEAGIAARSEGTSRSGWVLVDAGAVIVHLFSEEVRAYYDLEGLWSDARKTGWR